MSRALRRERKEAKQQDISMSNMGSTISILSNGNITSNHSNGNGVIPIKMKMEPAQDAEMMQDQNDGESRVTTIKQNGETSAIKTGTLATTGVTTGATTMVKLEPGTEEEDSNNNKNNDELNANVGNNLVTSVVNVKNEVKREVDAEPEPEPEAEAETVTETGTQTLPSLPQQQTQTNSNNRSNRIDDDQADIETMDMDSELNGDIFEFEEADVPLPPLYLLKDEGSDKWVLLNDLCNLLKVKSKDTLLNKVCLLSNLYKIIY